MPTIPNLEGLSWSKIRSLAREAAKSEPPSEVIETARSLLARVESAHRIFAVPFLHS